MRECSTLSRLTPVSRYPVGPWQTREQERNELLLLYESRRSRVRIQRLLSFVGILTNRGADVYHNETNDSCVFTLYRRCFGISFWSGQV